MRASTAAIQRRVAAHYGLGVGDPTSARKERRRTMGRRRSARTFGGRDRSTVAAAWRGWTRAWRPTPA